MGMFIDMNIVSPWKCKGNWGARRESPRHLTDVF